MKDTFSVHVSYYLQGQDGQDAECIFGDDMPFFPPYQVGQNIFLEVNNQALENPNAHKVISNYKELKSARYEVVRVDHSSKLHLKYDASIKYTKTADNDVDLVTDGIHMMRSMDVILKKVN